MANVARRRGLLKIGNVEHLLVPGSILADNLFTSHTI